MRYRGLGLLAVALLMLTLSGTGTGAPAAPVGGGQFVPDEVLVKFGPDVNPEVFARSIGARAHSRIAGLDVHVLKVRPGTAEAVVRALANHPLVEYAELNGIATIVLDPNDPYDNGPGCYDSSSGCVTQWAWARLQAYQAWDLTTGSASVRVAVVDTGVDNSHPDLPAVVAQYDFANGDPNAEDDNGHGTHVAGTIGASTNNGIGGAGSNWNVGILAAKVLNSGGSGSYAAVANGIRWAADNGAQGINLSLGGSLRSKTLERAVNYAWDKGAVLACAAGNSGTSSRLYPAAYTKCIAVAATDQDDVKASFSNFGASWVDVAAPGVAILSTMPDSFVYLNFFGYLPNYDALNGTSMATPHVAGLAALVRARGLCGSAATATAASCVRSRIETTADPISGTGTYWTWGRVNYRGAVQ